LRAPERAYPLFAPERDEVERRWLAAPPDTATAFAEADALLERWTERVTPAVTVDTRPVWVRRYWRARDRRAAGGAARVATG
jgi:hypothetical protein